MKIAITTETATDLSEEIKQKFNVQTVAFGVEIGDSIAKDGEIEIEEIFRIAKENNILPKTCAVNQYQYEEFFNDLKAQGYDAIVHLSLSSTISSAYQNAKAVADNMDNVFVIDSLSLCSGIALLVIKACELRDAGKSPEEIVEIVTALRSKVQLSLVVEKLNYLYKGGRCSAVQFFGSNILKIRPQILVNNGELSVGKKFRGKIEDVVKAYVENILEIHPNPNLDYAFFAYTTATDEMINNALTLLKNRGFKTIFTVRAGTTIASHTGEHSVGVMFLDN